MSVSTDDNRLTTEEWSARKIAAILQVSTTITSSFDLNEILNSTCQAAVELIGASHSGVVVFENNGDKGVVRAEYPKSDALGKEIQLRGVLAEERLIDERLPLMVSDVRNEE